MRNLLSRLWNDDRGSVLAGEWVFVATILVLGAVTGIVATQRAALETDDPAAALMQSEMQRGNTELATPR